MSAICNWRVLAAVGVIGLFSGLGLLQTRGLIDLGDVVYRYQSLIGTLIGIAGTGAIGFWSVNTTLRTNAENTQRQKEREIAHEANGIRATILAELLVLHSHLTIRLATARRTQTKNNFAVGKHLGGDELCRGYRAVISRIGLLTAHQIGPVVAAYACFEELNPNAAWLADAQLQMQIDMRKPNEYYDIYVQQTQIAIDQAEMAIRALGGTPEDLNALIQKLQK